MLEILKAVLFGVVEGITEWLPISSTGHMILLNEFVKLNVSSQFWDMFLVVIQFGAILAVILLWIFFYNPLLLTGLNEDLAAGKNIRVRFVSRLFSVVVAVIVTVSIKWVGILIINSLLVLPAATARNVARSSRSYLFFSVLFSMVAGISGLILSYYLGTSAGGTIVLISALLFFLSWIGGKWAGRARR